jgi:hypothetical protein
MFIKRDKEAGDLVMVLSSTLIIGAFVGLYFAMGAILFPHHDAKKDDAVVTYTYDPTYVYGSIQDETKEKSNNPEHSNLDTNW